MIAYGTGPAHDELEVAVFGPGFGEAIAVHFGDNRWLLVDSCLDPDTNEPATLTYLRTLGVPQEAVAAIVASHWHDDHVRGISRLARAYPEAEFHLSDAFNSREGAAVLYAYSGAAAPSLNRGTTELYRVLDEREVVYYSHQRSTILEVSGSGGGVRVTAFSPVAATITRSVAQLAQFLPRPAGGSPINNIVPLRPNAEAVVVHIEAMGTAVLLGSDLEDDATYGWRAVVADKWIAGRTRASAYKVAHHGSYTGDHSSIWTTLVQPGPVAAVTPYNRGSKLPTEDDVGRLKGRSPEVYLTSGAGRRPKIPAPQLKRLSAVVSNLAPVNNGFGAVRLRWRKARGAWTSECFGDARRL